ncbi:iron ABC transporter permease [Pelagibacterium sp. 26DY04]|uniref:ABC transporter permease n=1 Tax=Pelagibacterium sp. 26DY04 TaxID=2967130 RepID=UPI0028152AC7|nr:iron ABC transporter permease [Pelagibacterium sp. 26DY04]WMT87952.1 iron ABC transporter permease [Pelagibacterium sp. 26DY04]
MARFAPVALAIVAVGVLAALPLGRLMATALVGNAGLDFAPLIERLMRGSTQRAMFNTLDTAVMGAILALLIGTPFAFFVALTDVPFRRLQGFMLLLPLMIAPQVTALAYMQLLGPSSALLGTLGLAPAPGTPNPLLGRGGIILLYGIQHAPIVFITLRAGLTALPRDYFEAARAAGAGPWRVLATVTLPLMRPYFIAALALAFVSGVGNFGIPAFLGLPVNYLTLATLIYQQLASNGPTVLAQTAMLSLLIAAIAIVGIAIQSLAQKRESFAITRGAPLRLSLGGWRWPVAGIGLLLIGVMLVLPMLALLTTSLVPTYGVRLSFDTITLDNYVEVLARQASTIRAFTNSFYLSGLAALILALLAVPVALGLRGIPMRTRQALHGLLDLPYALPGIVLAIACILLFLRPLPLIGSLYNTPWIILVAYLMRFAALAVRPVDAALGQIPPQLGEAAAAAGAGGMRRLLTITLPLAAPAATAGALLVFMSAFNELTVSALLWSSRNETLGVILFSLDEAGLSAQASAVAVVTIAVVVMLLLALDRLAPRLPAGVLPWR